MRDLVAKCTKPALRSAGELIGIDAMLLEAALTTKHTYVPGRDDAIISPLDVEKASELRHALAKTMYERMFTWIVGRVNRSVENAGSGPKPNTPLHKRSGSGTSNEAIYWYP